MLQLVVLTQSHWGRSKSFRNFTEAFGKKQMAPYSVRRHSGLSKSLRNFYGGIWEKANGSMTSIEPHFLFSIRILFATVNEHIKKAKITYPS